jgi:hypothetical protein
VVATTRRGIAQAPARRATGEHKLRLDSPIPILVSIWSGLALSYGPPWAHYLGGSRTDYSVGPWDYPACATRHLKAWSTRTTQE